VHIFFIVCLYVHVLSLENQLSKEKGRGPINQFDPSTFVCLSESRDRFSIVICRGLLVYSEFISDYSDYLFCWNCLSLPFRCGCLLC
jgi:hypothetical protein